MLDRGLLTALLLVGVSACGGDQGSGGTDLSLSATTASEGTESSSASSGDTEDSEPAVMVSVGPESTVRQHPADAFDADPATLPDAVAPGGLSGAVLPDDAAGVAELFNALPGELFGVGLDVMMTGPGRLAAVYGSDDRSCGPTRIQADDLSAVDVDVFYPKDWTAENVIASFATGADWEVDDAGQDGDLSWVVWQTTCSGEGVDGVQPIFSTTWGEAGSPIVFFAGSKDSEARDHLISAFVVTAAEQAAAPVG